MADDREPTVDTEFYFQWHITGKCNRRCGHCYHSDYASTGELSNDELLTVVGKLEEALGKWGRTGAVAITGGEPWIRKDAVHMLVERMAKGKLIERVDILTNGGLLEDEDWLQLAEWPVVRRVQVSLEGATADRNDRIRGPGSFEETVQAIHLAKAHGVQVGVMMTLSKENLDQIEPVLRLLQSLQVDAFSVERFIPEGQALEHGNWLLSSDDVARAYRMLYAWKPESRAPRILMYRPLFCLITRNDERVGAMCSVGANALTIMHDGTIYPCRRLPIPLGNIRRDSIYDIWYKSDVLWQVRSPAGLQGKCHECEFIPICRGCRAMAYAVNGDWLAEDPHCWLGRSERLRLAEDIEIVHPEGTDIFFMYHSKSGDRYELNETAYDIVRQFDGRTSTAEVCDRVKKTYARSESIEQDMQTLIGELTDLGLVTFDPTQQKKGGDQR